MKLIDLTNQKINMLYVLKKVQSKNRRAYWLCKCDCGNEIKVMSQYLINKSKYSCGCTRKPSKNYNQKYDFKIKRLYYIWYGMKQRCYKKTNKTYKYYGNKGIKICDEWLNNFLNFQQWALNNGYKDYLSIDRIDSKKDYCPENCRWVSTKENNLNRKGIIKIKYNNKIICLKDYCKIKGISYNTALKKHKNGINIWEL